MQFPKPNKAAYVKFPNPASRYALVGVFVSKRSSEIRVAVTGAGSNGVFRVTSFEEALKKRFGAKSLEGMTVPADGMASDIHGSAEYRAHLIGVLARRAVAAAGVDSDRCSLVRIPGACLRDARPRAGHWRPGSHAEPVATEGRDKPVGGGYNV